MSDIIPPSPQAHDSAARAPSGRLHPSVIALWTLRAVLPLGVAVVATDTIGQAFGLAVLAVVGGASWVRWQRFTWRVDGDGLVIEQGLLQRTRRVIPLERIQAVQAERRLRHRVFGVVGLRVEAIGGKETEGQLDALAPDVARQVQRALLGGDVVVPGPDGRGGSAPRHDSLAGAEQGRDIPMVAPADALGGTVPPGTVLADCTPRQLLLAGLTGGRVGVVAAAVGLAQQVLGDGLANLAVSLPSRLGIAMLAVLAAVVAVGVFAVSVAATMLTYWNATVRRDGDLLRLHRGLLTERRDTVPVRRIQSMTVEQNFVRRALGLASVSVVVAGRAGDDGVTATLLPIGDRDAAFALVGDVLDVDGLSRAQLRSMPGAARSRRLGRAAVATVIAAAVAAWPGSWPWALAAGLGTATVTVPLALASYHALGWTVHADTVLGRSGALVQRTTVTPIAATQSGQLSSSPFQRRRNLATLHQQVAHNRGVRDPRLLDMDEREAAKMLQMIVARADDRSPFAPAG